MLLLLCLLLALSVALLTARIWRVSSWKKKPFKAPPLKTLIVLGSGGHTAEILNLVAALDKQEFYPRIYVAALTDNMSLSRAQSLETTFSKEYTSVKDDSRYLQIYRSREVGQSYITSVLTTIYAMLHGLWIVFQIRPDIILCNGPGTCIPICLAGFLLKIVSLKWVAIVYVESIARVRRLSLSGLILYKLNFADRFYVQWPQLQQKFPQTQYVGRLL